MLTAGERTPGPSDYRADSRPTLPGKPAYTIAGRQSHASFKQNTPGPGAYAVRGNSKTVGCHPNAPGYSMPASGRPTLQSHRLPGPGGRSHPLSSACTMQTGHTMLPAGVATHTLRPMVQTSFHILCRQEHKQPLLRRMSLKFSRLVYLYHHIQPHTVACLQLQCMSMYAEYCTEVHESGPRCSMKFRHEAGRLTGSPVAPPGPGQYSVTAYNRPRSAAFTFGCSRPQSGSQTARCAHVICSLAAAVLMVKIPGKMEPVLKQNFKALLHLQIVLALLTTFVVITEIL